MIHCTNGFEEVRKIYPEEIRKVRKQFFKMTQIRWAFLFVTTCIICSWELTSFTSYTYYAGMMYVCVCLQSEFNEGNERTVIFKDLFKYIFQKGSQTSRSRRSSVHRTIDLQCDIGGAMCEA